MSAATMDEDDWRDELAVFPLRPGDKTPMVKWRTESAAWEEWTGRWPKGAGVGIDCGKSGLVVLDEDEPEAVQRWLGYVPLTYTVRTGKGRHFYFRAPDGPPLRNGVRVADGVDVRADGGYVVGAGSLHPSGTRYAVENGGEPRALPPEVVPMLTTPAPPPPAQPGTLPDVIPQGRRDTTLFRYACALEARGVGDGEALPLLREAWARCSPPYTEKSPEQMWSAVVAAYRRGHAGCGHVPPCPSDLHHERLSWREADVWAAQTLASAADDGASFLPVSLIDAPDQPPARYLDMGGGHKFVRPGDITTIHGKNSAGKSPLLNLIAADHLAVDTDALWIAVDYELGRAKFRTRLFEQGFTVAMLDRIYYVEHPGLLTEQGGDVLVKNVLDYAEQRGLVPRLLTWDTYTRSASRLPNADPEKNATINAWFTSHVDWARQAFESLTGEPLTQYVTDHSNLDDAIRPGGGHAKQDRVTNNLWLKACAGFARTHEKGYSKAIVNKHNAGDYTHDEHVFTLRSRLLPGGGSQFWIAPTEAGTAALAEGHTEVDLSAAPAWSFTRHESDAEVLDDLRQRGPIRQTEFTGGGRVGQDRRKALKRLRDAGLADFTSLPGRGSPREWYALD